LPGRVVAGLPADAFSLYDLVWGPAHAAGRLEFIVWAGVAIDAGTVGGYLRANLTVSGGDPVVGAGAHVAGTLVRTVVWPGARVGPDEVLVDAVRTPEGLTVTAAD